METFLVETLKSVKLSKTIQDQRDRLVEKITRLLEEIPGSGASSQVDVSNGSLKISGGKGHICSFLLKWQTVWIVHVFLLNINFIVQSCIENKISIIVDLALQASHNSCSD